MSDTLPWDMPEQRDLPADFGARVRAARGYRDASRPKFAALLNTEGAGSGTIKAWEETGHMPPPLSAPTLVTRLAEISGLPESFFWGDSEPEAPAGDPEDALTKIQVKLTEIDAAVSKMAFDTTARDMEARKRLAEVVQAIRRLPPGPPP